jgi:protein-S-isoprenylcysteine O-methyltransferase Ste14
MKVITALLTVAVMLFSLNAHAYQFLHPFGLLQINGLRYAGLLLIHASLVWIVIAQYNMKQSWRIGIDNENKTALITTGLFRVSRNPVFLGMMVSTVGIFLIIPDAITFFVATTTYIILQIQIRLEEEFLYKKHGAGYQDYTLKVRRLL